MLQCTIDKTALAYQVQRQLHQFVTAHLGPLRPRLNAQTYRNLVDLTEGLVRMDAGTQALWTSHLATELYGGDHEPAGVKRVERVLAHSGWRVYDVQTALQARGEERAATITGDVLIALDPSDLEKPESLQSEGLQKVVSPTARHLARPRRGFGGAPLSRPVTVPGLHFIAAVLMGMHGPALLLDYRWWHKRPTESQQTITLLELTHALALRYQQVHPIFVGDRGVGNRAIMGQWVAGQVRFVVRFNEHVGLCAMPGGELQAVKDFLKRQRGTVACPIYDTKLRRVVTVRLRWCSVWLPQHPQPLTLVIVRHPTRSEDWRLVTNLPVHTAAQAIHIAQIYARRWQVEWSLRFLKSELVVESPRLQIWERREKLLALVFLVYAWFVHLLVDHDPLVQSVLEAESHRTGRRSRLTYAPLYRLRHALRRLLTRYLPTPVIARSRMATC